jgi:Radical SAM superfamily
VLVVRPRPSRPLGAFCRNLGLTMLATHLRASGMDPQLADLTFDSYQAALDSGARTAAFSLYIDDFAEGARLAAAARDAGLTTAVGGPHATLLGADVQTATDAFTLAGAGDCLPEAMPVIARLAQGHTPGGPVRVTSGGGRARMDALAPDYSAWPDDGRYFPVFPVEFSRGCRQHCPFCTDPVLRDGMAVDPVERTLSTLQALARAHAPLWVRFVDSSLSSLGPDLDRLLEAMITAGLTVQWSAYAYPHDIDAALAARMARAGCRALFLGIESLAPGVRVGKHHAKDPGEIVRAVDLLHGQGIFVHGNFIIGLPGETPGTVEQTLAGISRIGFDSVGGGPFYLTPGSTFERRPGKFGIRILDPGWRVRQHVNFYDPAHEYFATATLTQRQMKSLAAEFRQQVEAAHQSCWNLSDYALLCWLSAGGTTAPLTALWQKPDKQMTPAERQVTGVLKEKDGALAAEGAASFVAATRELAASYASQVGRQ